MTETVTAAVLAAGSATRFGGGKVLAPRGAAAVPALPDFVELLSARGRQPAVERVVVEPRRFDTRASLEGYVRRLWIDPSGPNEARLQSALDELAVEDGAGWTIKGRDPSDIGIVTWESR